jgi:PAS domain S-box-containing protein
MTGSIIPIRGIDWHVLAAKSDASLYRTPLHITLIVLTGILIALSCSVLTSVYLARRLAGRFEDLNNHARSIAEGGNPGEWPSATIAEFNILSENLQRMARRLQDSEILYRSLVDNSVDVIFALDAAGVFRFVSPAWEKHFGYPVSDVLNQGFLQLVHSDDIRPCEEFLTHIMSSGDAAASPIFRVRHRKGEWRYFIANGSIYEDSAGIRLFLGIGRDISDQIRAEEERLNIEKQMLHSQKLESLGVLAGGIAHDFNNILTAIIGNADLALMRVNKESPAVENLHRIEQAALRAADLAKQMLAYSGKGRFVIENINLNNLLEEMLHMLEVSISKKAVLRLNPYQHLPTVEADATQMRQIIMNLVINASEAIGDRSGVIAVTTGCMECDRSYLKDVWMDEHLTDGLYVYLEIVDSGCGMDRETLGKLFDPFFTTKFTGRGLGMAAVLGIVRGHKGAIKVYSELGKGTSFKILLPASGKTADLLNGDSNSDDWQGGGTVLLVDDEETIRGIGTEMLKELGFTTITAVDGQEAVEAFRANPDIAFVILDLTMPHLDGEHCFRELRQLDPNVNVIMSSGYNEHEVFQKFIGEELSGFLQKPYKLSALKEAIRKLEKAEK